MSRPAAPLVLAGPSGTGKTTLARRLVESSDDFVFSVSATTRPARDGERDGVDYHFVDRAGFESMIAAGELVEWAEVHGRLYGTLRADLEAAAAAGRHVVLDIDVQGARQIRDAVPGARLIFVLPPSVDIMMARLAGRGTEAPAEIVRRLRTALEELRAVPEFDHVVVNDDLKRSLKEIRHIARGGEGGAPEGHLDTVEAYRSEIARLLERERGEASHETGRTDEGLHAR